MTLHIGTWIGRTTGRLIGSQLVERLRRPGYLFAVAAVMLFAYLLTPKFGDRLHFTLSFGVHRGIYNSAWVGTVYALTIGLVLSMFGFYLVKGGVLRDGRTGVGEILAATRLSNLSYLATRAFSNLLYLLCIAVPMLLVAPVMQLIRGEDRSIDVIALVSPFVLIALPPLAIVAALAVWFETVPVLRGGVGNIIFLIAWTGGMGATVETMTEYDLFCLNIVETDGMATLRAVKPDFEGGFILGGGPGDVLEPTFVWDGIPWTRDHLLARLAWTGGALLPLSLSVPFFTRFDSSRWVRSRRARKRSRRTPRRSLQHALLRIVKIPLAPVAWLLSGFAFGRLVSAELRILVGSINAWWLGAGFGLLIASVFSPLAVVREYLLVFLWLWPILAWSQLGVRERVHRVAPVLFSAPRPVRRQLLASWLSGALVSLFIGAPAMLRFASVGRSDVAAAVLGAALFVPSLALFLGVASRTSRLFEIVYLALWYVGPLEKAPAVDFLGSTDAALAMGIPTICAVLTGALFAAALVLRSRQLRD